MQPKNKTMLPKFLLATNSQQRLGYIYIVHNESPRFILEGSEDDFENDKKIYWIDKPEISKNEIDELIAEAEYFLDDELDCEDNLTDDGEL